ncbi:MAG TPA: hypothetical protein VGM75_00815 [Pseudonocardiaceae bacterium]|jgi:hypothetical protein
MKHTIKIRDVDEQTYRMLCTRANNEGLALDIYLKKELARIAGPTMAELIERADRRRARGRHVDGGAIAEAITKST